MRPYLLASGIFFAMIAVAHLLRAIAGVPIQAGDIHIPVWVSWPAAVVTGVLAVWAFALCRKKT